MLLKRGINVRSLVEKSDLVDAVASSDPALVPADYSKVKTYKKGDLQTFLANKNPVHDSVITFSEETYVGGQYCDEIKQGRSASVHYRCDPKLSHSRQAFIDTIEEVSTCTYKIVISTPLLCAGHRAAARVIDGRHDGRARRRGESAPGQNGRRRRGAERARRRLHEPARAHRRSFIAAGAPGSAITGPQAGRTRLCINQNFTACAQLTG